MVLLSVMYSVRRAMVRSGALRTRRGFLAAKGRDIRAWG